MADANYNGLDQTPSAYELERALLWADKANRNPNHGPADAGARCVAEWGDDLDNAHRAIQMRLSGAFANVREYESLDDAVDAAAALAEGGLLVIPPSDAIDLEDTVGFVWVDDDGNVIGGWERAYHMWRCAVGIRLGPAATGPTLTFGAGAPSASEPNGSIYLRTDGAASTTIYRRAAGAWTAVA